MNKLGISVSLRHLVALGALALGAAAFAGCAAPVQPEESDEADATGEAESAFCCSEGTVWCPGVAGSDIDYGCGGPTRTSALSACNRTCSTTCSDTGWHTTCY